LVQQRAVPLARGARGPEPPARRLRPLQVARETGVHYDDLHLPVVMRAAYGKRPPKLVMMVRNPIDRLHSAYWQYEHYKKKYGLDPDGFTRCAAGAQGLAPAARPCTPGLLWPPKRPLAGVQPGLAAASSAPSPPPAASPPPQVRPGAGQGV
jgi:hypothetical protein